MLVTATTILFDSCQQPKKSTVSFSPCCLHHKVISLRQDCATIRLRKTMYKLTQRLLRPTLYDIWH